MTVQRTFVTYGVAVGVRSNDPELLDRVPERLPPGWREASSSRVDVRYSLMRRSAGSGARVHYELREGDQKLGEGFRLSPLLDAMDSAVRLRVGALAPERLFVHAGAVAWQDRAIILPGSSGAGKTTLVVALVGAGATYYSDEYAVLDSRGHLHPYARPISCRQGANRRLTLDAERDLGARRGTTPLPVALVVHTVYRPGADWAPRPMSPGESALGAFAHVVAARERAAFAFSALSRAISHAVSLQGDRGDADATASAILQLAGQIPLSPRGI
ncbi:MAG TPA: hypothetical protein VG818_09965 [Gemmatimonadaceae bacterium]|nr:hypothetical protein [Gemmatimonadaceae bacterium]